MLNTGNAKIVVDPCIIEEISEVGKELGFTPKESVQTVIKCGMLALKLYATKKGGIWEEDGHGGITKVTLK
jgi:hypothetical protein